MTDREKFVNWASKLGFNEEDVWQFLRLTMSPESLGGYYQICENLFEIIQFLEEFEIEDSFKTINFDIWSKLCSAVIIRKNDLRDIFGDNVCKGLNYKTKTPPTYGQMTNYAVSTAFYHAPEESELDNNYFRLCGLILSCQIYTIINNNDFSLIKYINEAKYGNFIGHLFSPFKNIGKLLRTLVYADERSALLLLSPSESIKSVKDYYSEICELESEDPENKMISNLRVFLDRTYQNIENETIRGGGGKKRTSWTKVKRYGYGEIETDLFFYSPKERDNQEQGFKSIKLPRGFKNEWLDGGLTFEELFEELYYEDETEQFFLPYDAKNFLAPASARMLLTEEARRYTGIRNNFLSTSIDIYTNDELQLIIQNNTSSLEQEYINYKNSNDSKFTPEAYLNFEANLFLLLALVTGSSWERAYNCLHLDSLKSQQRELAYLTDKCCFRIRVKHPIRKKRIQENLRELIEKPINYLLLPDSFNINKYIKSLLELHDKVNKKKLRPVKKIRVFKSKFKYLKNQVNKTLKEIEKPKGLILTYKRIEKALQYKIIEVSGGDVVIAEMITGATGLGPVAQHHYAMPSARFLEKHYRNAIKKMTQDINFQENYLNSIEDRITNGICVKTSTIKNCLAKIRSELDNNKKPVTISEVVTLHNAFTLYVLIIYLLVTGYRFSINPDADPSKISKSGILKFGDKLSDDCYQKRIAWIPEEVVSQLEMYSKHRTKVLGALFSKLHFGSSYFVKNNPFLFFVDPEMFEPVEIRPASWNEFVVKKFPVPMNFSRAYMRSQLMMNNCPVDVQRAYMGHTWLGVESYGKFSSLSPLYYIKTIKPFFENLIKDIDFKAIKGL